MVNFGPCKYDVVEVGGEDHYALTFEKGSVVFLSTNIMKGKKITAPITDYFIDYGHVPWFIDAVKHAELIRDTDYFNGVRLGGGQPVYDMMVANIARDPKDIRTQWRHTIKTEADITKRPLFIPLRDIAETTTSNFARLNGSELKQGISRLC
jgi:hypothetical protein